MPNTMSDVRNGMQLEKAIRGMKELIDEYEGKELTDYRHDRLAARFGALIRNFYDALERAERQSNG